MGGGGLIFLVRPQKVVDYYNLADQVKDEKCNITNAPCVYLNIRLLLIDPIPEVTGSLSQIYMQENFMGVSPVYCRLFLSILVYVFCRLFFHVIFSIF